MAIPAASMQRWLVIQAVVWTLVLVWLGWMGEAVITRSGAWLGGGGLAIASYLWLLRILRCGRRPADQVTFLRFLGLCALLVLVGTGRGSGWGTWVLMVFVVLSDLLDGWAARTWGGSEEGALLDQETDQLTTLVLSAIAFTVRDAGAWTLLLPGFKYLYVLGLTVVGLPAHDPKPREGDNLRGRFVCALVMTLLLAALCPAATPTFTRGCTMVAVFALAFSFASDARFLWAHRAGVLRGR